MNHLIFILHLTLAAILISRYHRLRWKGISKWSAVTFFTLKCVLIYFLFGYFNNHPQPGDVRGYLHDAQLLFEMLRSETSATLNFIFFNGDLPIGYSDMSFEIWNEPLYLPFFNDAHTIILMNVLLRFISMGVYGVNLVWFCFIGWMGMCMMSHSLFHGKESKVEWMLPFLIPQVFLWSATVLKEPFMIFALGCLLNGVVQYRRKAPGAWKFLLGGSLVFLFVKTFILILLLPGLLAFFLSRKFKRLPAYSIFISTLAVLMLSFWLLSFVSPFFHLPQLVFGQQLNMYRYVIFSKANSILDPIMLAPVWASLLKRIPESIGYALFQPFPWLYSVKLGWLVFTENILVAFYLLYGMIKRGRGIMGDPVRLFLLCGGCIILALAGFVAPVAGTLIRFKMPGILLLALAVGPFTHEHHHHSSSKHPDDYLSNS